MNIFNKAYWEIVNNVVLLKNRGIVNAGLFPHRTDPQDWPFLGANRTYFADINIATKLWVFDQEEFNCCVFAAGVMAVSYQEGKRFSVKFAVKVAMYRGWIKGNGWSYLRAVLKVWEEYGGLDYADMPDEVGDQSFEEYSKWDVTAEQLEKAKKNCVNYRIIKNEAEAREAIRGGYCVLSGGDWWSEMNDPKGPDFYLEQKGYVITAHMTVLTGCDDKGWINTQTFGKDFADQGKARFRSIVGKGRFTLYVIDKQKDRRDIDRVMSVYENQMIRCEGSDKWFTIKDGRVYEIPAGTPGTDTFYYLPKSVILSIPGGEAL